MSAPIVSPSGSTCIARTPTACWPLATPITASVHRSSSRPIVRPLRPPGSRRRYAGRCRALPQAVVAARLAAGEAAVVRFRVPERRDVTFDDLVRGPVTINTDVIGDPVLLRSDGHPAYNFAVVVDDGLMGVTTVVRGEDHIPNTPRQVLLYEAFGWTPPTFAHLSLVLGPDHAPLSKRHGATSVVEFRARGYLPEALVNYLALVGWSPGGGDELLPLEELARRFSLDGVSHSAGVFDVDKLAWVNRHYLKSADRARLCGLSLPYLQQAGLATAPGDAARAWLTAILPMATDAVDRLDQVPARLSLVFAYNAAEALARDDVRAEFATEGARCRGAGTRRGPRTGAPVDRPRAVSRRRPTCPREDRTEGQGVVSSHPRCAHGPPRRPGARSARAGHRHRRGAGRR